MGMLDNIPDKTQVRVLLHDGTSFSGTLRRSAGWPSVSVPGLEPFSLADVSPTFGEVKAITLVSDKASNGSADAELRANCIHAADNETGRPRQDDEDTLWQLTEMVIETNRQTNIHRTDYSDKILRSMQLENQFHQVADQIDLAKTKRRYILNVALIRKRGGPRSQPESKQSTLAQSSHCIPDKNASGGEPARRQLSHRKTRPQQQHTGKIPKNHRQTAEAARKGTLPGSNCRAREKCHIKSGRYRRPNSILKHFP